MQFEKKYNKKRNIWNIEEHPFPSRKVIDGYLNPRGMPCDLISFKLANVDDIKNYCISKLNWFRTNDFNDIIYSTRNYNAFLSTKQNA